MSHPIVFLESQLLKEASFGGFSTFNLELIRALVKENSRYRFQINLREPNMMRFFESPLCEYSPYGSWQRNRWFWMFKKINLWHSLNQGLAIEPFKVDRYVVTIHDLIQYDIEKYRKRIDYKVRRADAIVYISEYVKDMAHQKLSIGAHVDEYVIYNGCPEWQSDMPGGVSARIAMNRPYLYSIGNFERRKNFHSLVELMRVNKDFDLIISGNHDTEYGAFVKDLIAKYGLSDRVLLTGSVSSADKWHYLKHASAFMFPSMAEGFGLPILEAMKVGVPVFLAATSCLPEVGGDAAYYFPSFDAEQMRGVLYDGLHHFAKNREEMLHRFRKRVEFFSWKRTAIEYLKVYDRLLME